MKRWIGCALALSALTGCDISEEDLDFSEYDVKWELPSFELPDFEIDEVKLADLSIGAFAPEAQAAEPPPAPVEKAESPESELEAEPSAAEDELLIEFDEDEIDDLLELQAPPVRYSGPVRSYTRPRSEGALVARPFWFNSPVYEEPDERRRVAGVIRRNTELPVARRVSGKGCKTGAWYQLVGGGYVCRGDGYSISANPEPLPPKIRNRRPGSESPLPFSYAKVRKGNPPLYWRLPTSAELEEGAPEPIRERSTGAHFAAIEEFIEHEGRTFAKTVRGQFVNVDDLKFMPPSRMSGELLEGDAGLPLAFVFEDYTPVHDPETLEVVGIAEKYARDGVEEEVEDHGVAMVRLADGHLVPRASVRVAYPAERPAKIPEYAQWIAIDLDEQTLVAYEGDQPVLATLVASGKAGYEPPTGVFQIGKKYLSKTMSGPDDIAGTYRVEQVPWTMYYWGSFALHAAYWHDGFGKGRSHGCTNIPPVDARWIFHWAKPELPTGWQGAVRLEGPYLYFYRSSQ